MNTTKNILVQAHTQQCLLMGRPPHALLIPSPSGVGPSGEEMLGIFAPCTS